MKILSKRIKVTLFVAVTVLFALTLLLMNSSKVYCAPSSGTLATELDLNDRGFFSDRVQTRESNSAKRIYDSDNEYKSHNYASAEWKYPNEDTGRSMRTRNEEFFFLYATDSTGTEVKLNPVTDTEALVNENAENHVFIRFKQEVDLPSNVERNSDDMTLNSYKLNSYYKISGDSTKIGQGIILFRTSEDSAQLENSSWQSLKLQDNVAIYVESPKYVEINLLYELREKKGSSSYYSHCIARYFLWVATR